MHWHRHDSFLQADINDKMRAILLDWLVEVHLKFKVKTLYSRMTNQMTHDTCICRMQFVLSSQPHKF